MKVLILSHNCFRIDQSMGKTLMGLFQSFSSNELCQLYFYPSYPTVDRCHSSYKITDMDMVRNIIKRAPAGERVSKEKIKIQSSFFSESAVTGAALYRIGRNDAPIVVFGRRLLWQLGDWNTNDLSMWLQEEHPDIIFYASGDASFSFRIARKLSAQLKIPLVTYVCDDYYLFQQKKWNPLYHLNQWLLRCEMYRTYQASVFLVTICDSMSRSYETIFHRKAITLMTSSAETVETKTVQSIEYGICYTGNVRIGRWRALVEIGQILQQINADIGSNYILNIYSSETDPKILAQFTLKNGISFHGNVSGEQVNDIIRRSLLLIHVESMKTADRERVRFSVSTKISDALAFGSCIFAYGPEEVASIQHLIKHKAACVVTDPIKLKETLSKLLSSEEQRNSYIESARDLAFQRHNGARDSTMLKTMLEKVVMEASTFEIMGKKD